MVTPVQTNIAVCQCVIGLTFSSFVTVLSVPPVLRTILLRLRLMHAQHPEVRIIARGVVVLHVALRILAELLARADLEWFALLAVCLRDIEDRLVDRAAVVRREREVCDDVLQLHARLVHAAHEVGVVVDPKVALRGNDDNPASSD